MSLFFLSHSSISIAYRLHEIIIILSFIAHAYFILPTWKMVIDIHEFEREKHQRKTFQRFYDPFQHFK